MRRQTFLAAAMLSASALAAYGAGNGLAPMGKLRPDQIAFRGLYKELVEIDTSPATGNCTLAASKMADRLRAAGYPDSDINAYVPPGFPRDGGLIATLHGSDIATKAILLMAHIDVVNVDKTQWKTDPFTLIEDKTYFHGRGTSDDKAMAAVFVDSLIRLRQEGFKPKRDIKIFLTCGEETGSRIKDAQWVANTHKDWIDAGLALNEGAAGELDEKGNRVSVAIQSGERSSQDITLTTTDAGGHAARPHAFNSIVAMSNALAKIGAYEFPVMFTDVTRLFFAKTAELRGGKIGAAIKALLANPKDEAADAIVSQNPEWHATLRTTCVPTMVKGGVERSALPENVEANLNCRIWPGISPQEIVKTLQSVINDPHVTITLRLANSTGKPSVMAPVPPPLTPEVLDPPRQVAAKMWPGVPLIPTMSTGSTDARFITPVGIPTYGLSGMFHEPDGGGVHGVDERLPVRSLYEGRDFLHSVVKIYAAQ
jgi:acetylornithine deacetylase/succinyl-diaminopimelate desuccinylase-like protein